MALEHIEHAGKRKAPAYKKPVVEPKRAKALELDIPAVVENPLAELSLEPCNEIMADAPAMQQGQRVEALYAPVMDSQAEPSSQREAHLAPEIPELKAQPVALDVVDFPDNVPAQAGPAQLLFMHALSIPAPPSQFAMVILTIDLRTLEQYNGLVATQQKTAAASKSKGKVVATIKDESDYGQFLSEDEQESEEGELAAQHF
ncbi:hypothetical protein C0995_010280 [Termitomyces sp. Mi166|nr:hypothetical protein C0995_010280 [Termitomyces sp. Mi166\